MEIKGEQAIAPGGLAYLDRITVAARPKPARPRPRLAAPRAMVARTFVTASSLPQTSLLLHDRDQIDTTRLAAAIARLIATVQFCRRARDAAPRASPRGAPSREPGCVSFGAHLCSFLRRLGHLCRGGEVGDVRVRPPLHRSAGRKHPVEHLGELVDLLQVHGCKLRRGHSVVTE